MSEENFWEDCEHSECCLNDKEGNPIRLCLLTEDDEGYADYCLEDKCDKRGDLE